MEWLKFWQRGRKDRELALELEAYLDQETQEHIAAGLSPEDARRRAMRKLGNATRVREQVYEMHSVPILDTLWRDARYALRQLRRAPAFTIAAIASLALGIGANTAVFQLLNALSLRSLPVAHPEQLVSVRLVGEGRYGRQTGRNRQFSNPQWQALAERQQAFSSMLAFGDTRFNLSPQGEVRYVEGLWVSGSYFPTLGIGAALGRVFTPDDDRPGCGLPGAVISHAFWRRELGGRSNVIGERLDVGFGRAPILGVTPPDFFGVEVGRQFDVALPICAAEQDRRDHWWLAAIGRLRPGWTIAQAQAHLQGLLPAVQQDTIPIGYRPDYTAKYLTLRAELVEARAGVSPLRRSYQRPLWILLAIAGLVLLMASVNLANLLLARATARQQEFAIRLAIGGSRARILQQVFTETLLLTAIGAVAALGVALVASESIVSLISTPVDRIFLDLAVDWPVFGFTAAVAALAALIFGIAPAVRAVRATSLRTGERTTTGTRESLTLRRGLVAAQVAVTLMLLFGALLFLRSFLNLTTTETGFRADNVLVANMFFRGAEFPEERREAAYRDLVQRLRALPGVTGVAGSSSPPLSGAFWDSDIKIDGAIKGEANINQVTAGYFAVMGTPILAGRDFDQRDTPSSARIAIVNQLFAARYLGDAPLGKTVTMPGNTGAPDTLLTVVGVVKDQKYYTVREEFSPMLFLAFSQERSPGTTQRYVIHSVTPPAQLIGPITSVLAEMAPTAGVRFATLQNQIDESLLQERLMARLSGLFGAVALVLAIVGLYGVVAYTAASRRNEIGVRVALGAGRGRIVRMMLGDVSRMLAVGLVIGCAASLAGARAVSTLLYRLDATDGTTLGLSVALLCAAGLLAALLPARRAASLDPLQALESEQEIRRSGDQEIRRSGDQGCLDGFAVFWCPAVFADFVSRWRRDTDDSEAAETAGHP